MGICKCKTLLKITGEWYYFKSELHFFPLQHHSSKSKIYIWRVTSNINYCSWRQDSSIPFDNIWEVNKWNIILKIRNKLLYNYQILGIMIYIHLAGFLGYLGFNLSIFIFFFIKAFIYLNDKHVSFINNWISTYHLY